MRLVINTGSTSKKYAVFDGENLVAIYRFEIYGDGFRLLLERDNLCTEEHLSRDEFDNALCRIEKDYDFTFITRIGVRVVSPGSYFTEHKIIDEAYIEELRRKQRYAPLHIPPLLLEIEKAREFLPHALIIGVSDSEFHKTTLPEVRHYSIPKEDTEQLDIHRFGFHGISVSSIVNKLRESSMLEQRVIVCHIGGGASVTALHNGISIDTSMGFSPLSGLHMSSRSGDIDPDAILYIQEEKGVTTEELRQYLYCKCGLVGLGGNQSMRILLEQYHTDGNAKYAVDTYVTRLKKYIGGYIALLGGLDTLVLTGTISERNGLFRTLLCQDMDGLGIRINEIENEEQTECDTLISASDSSVEVMLMCTEELKEIDWIVTRYN